MNWLPHEIGSLFFDEIDHYGLIYWYNTVVRMINKINTPPPTTTPTQ